MNRELKDITEKQLREAKILWPGTMSLPAGQIDFSLVTVNPYKRWGGRDLDRWRRGGWEMLNPSTDPPTCWDSEADYQRMRDGVWGDLRNEKQVMTEAEENSWYRKKKITSEKDRVRKYSVFSLNKKGERWQHFTCWRMKVFIVAKMRATLQKQHRDTTVTQPGTQPQPLTVVDM